MKKVQWFFRNLFYRVKYFFNFNDELKAQLEFVLEANETLHLAIKEANNIQELRDVLNGNEELNITIENNHGKVRSFGARVLAEHFSKLFEEVYAPNFIEFSFKTKECSFDEHMIVTIQAIKGKHPSQIIKELKEENAALKEMFVKNV